MNDPRVSFEIALMILIIAGVAVLVVIALKKGESGSGLSTELQNLTQAIQMTQSNGVLLAEKMTRLEPVSQSLGAVQVELRGLGERVSQVEGKQSLAGQSLELLGRELANALQSLNVDLKGVGERVTTVEGGQNLASRHLTDLQKSLTATQTTAESMSVATTSLQSELSQALQRLTDLQSQAKARQESERQSAESIRRLEAIIAGTHSKGAAGENILDVVFSALPVEWQERNFRVGNKTVEFGLRLPNRLILPIDSKWPATSLLEEFLKCEDQAERLRLKSQIADAALKKASEVTKYLDPDLTVNFGIAAIPDAAFDLCGEVQAKAFSANVVLISYSMFVPYLLLVFQTFLKSSSDIDLVKLEASLQTAQKSLTEIQKILEGSLSKSIIALGNARDGMRKHLAKIDSGLSSLRVGDASLDALPDETPVIQLPPDGIE